MEGLRSGLSLANWEPLDQKMDKARRKYEAILMLDQLRDGKGRRIVKKKAIRALLEMPELKED